MDAREANNLSNLSIFVMRWADWQPEFWGLTGPLSGTEGPPGKLGMNVDCGSRSVALNDKQVGSFSALPLANHSAVGSLACNHEICRSCVLVPHRRDCLRAARRHQLGLRATAIRPG